MDRICCEWRHFLQICAKGLRNCVIAADRIDRECRPSRRSTISPPRTTARSPSPPSSPARPPPSLSAFSSRTSRPSTGGRFVPCLFISLFITLSVVYIEFDLFCLASNWKIMWNGLDIIKFLHFSLMLYDRTSEFSEKPTTQCEFN